MKKSSFKIEDVLDQETKNKLLAIKEKNDPDFFLLRGRSSKSLFVKVENQSTYLPVTDTGAK